jgi:hypothetical protein
MEPQSPNFNLPPVAPRGVDSLPPSLSQEIPNYTLENVPEKNQEVFSDHESHEKIKQPIQQSGSTTLPPPQPSDDTTDAPIVDPITPTIANDDDIIEKEWVNKSKKIVTATKGDPYQREQEVSKLQAQYIQKRYGKEVKLPEGTS